MRWWLFSVLLAMTSAAWWLGHDVRVGAVAVPAGSTASTAGNGLALAFAWAAKHGTATTLHRAPSEVPDNGVVLRWLPGQPAEHLAKSNKKISAPPLLSAVDDHFVRRGGRLVFAIAEAYAGLSAVSATSSPNLILPFLPGVRSLTPPLSRQLLGTGTAGVLLTDSAVIVAAGDQPVITRCRWGAGDIWLVAIPEVLDNAHLQQADHLALLAGLIAGRPVWFDETVHGASASGEVVVLLRSWGCGPLLLLLALAGGAWWWRTACPVGRPESSPLARDIEAIEGVDALAVLLGNSATDSELLTAQRERLVRQLARRRLIPHLEADRLLPHPVSLTDLPELHYAYDSAYDRLRTAP